MNPVPPSSSLTPQARQDLQDKISRMDVKDRTSFGLIAKYKCFEPYEKARICAQQVYQMNEALRRKVLELQDRRDQTDFMQENYHFILKKCEKDILGIGDCILKGQLAMNP